MSAKSSRTTERTPRTKTTAAAPVPAPPRRQIARARAAPRGGQPDRKLNILLAAEKLFAQHGYHGVSIRDIAQDAGVPLALVGYHYGAKHELYEAIFDSWRPLLEVRTQSLDAALAAEPAHRLERILEAVILPPLELHRHPDGRHFALMAARDLAIQGPESDAMCRRYFDVLAQRAIEGLSSVFPKATRGQVAWCYQFVLGAMLHFMTDTRVERLSNGENKAADPAAQAHLLRFVTAGVRALLEPPRR